MEKTNSYRFDQLETLRGLLAWWVVTFHCLSFTGLNTSPTKNPLLFLLSRGDLAVDGFIILSGIVITNLILNKHESYQFYIKRRFFRLAPIYFTALLVSICLQNLYLITFKNLSTVTDPVLFAPKIERITLFWQHKWEYILLHLTMLHGLVPDQLLANSSTAILTPAWSISLEWQFYLVAPLLLFFVKKGKLYPLVLVFLCITCFIIKIKYPLNFEGAFLPHQIWLFLVGVYTFIVYSSKKNVFLNWLVLTFMITCSIAAKNMAILPIALSLSFFFIPNLIKKESSAHNLVYKLTTIPFLQKLGKISYSTYLFHQAVQLCVLFLMMSYFHINNKLQLFAICFISSSIIVYFLSLLLFRYIEQKGIEIGKIHFTKKKAAEVVTIIEN